MKKRLAFDMSSFMWTMMSWGKDKENGRTVNHDGKDVYINSALYGYDNTLGRMLDVVKQFKLNPINCILAFEGANSKSRRLMIDNTYKGGGAPSRPPEAYDEFHKLREMLKQTWKDLGAQTMWQDAAEGDDVLGWLAHNTEDDLVVATFDNDLTVLNMTNQHGAKVETWINEMVGFNKYGTFDYDLVTTYKALVGDSSDNIKGCPGFGPAKWQALLDQYGEDGVREIHNMLLDSRLKDLGEFISGPEDKLLQKILDDAPQVQRCFDLARIRPEWVNTMRMPIHWEPGMVRQLQPTDTDPRLKKWYGKTRLITADNFDDAVAWAQQHIAASEEIALDIETSTPDESDEWLAAMGDPDGVDVFGSYLCGLGLTFGPNNQYTFYISVKHADTNNVDSEKVRQLIASIPQDKPLVIQNVSFELAVLFNEWGGRQLDNGYHGFLPNVLDTALEASYVDENSKRGLKERSHSILGYRQQTYDETVRITAHPSELFPGGRLLHEDYETQLVGTGRFEPLSEEEIAAGMQPVELMKTEYVTDEAGNPVVKTQTRRYKMHELPAWHVLGYGADDPICTIALHNYYKLHMQLEHHWEVYKQVEINAAYQHAKNFIDGCDISLEKMNELAAEDDKVYDGAWAKLRDFLIEEGWEGTQPPQYTADITPAQVKEAFQIVTGRPLTTQMRTLSKIVKFIREVEDEPQFAGMLEKLVEAQPLLADLRDYAAEQGRLDEARRESFTDDEPFAPWALTPEQQADAERVEAAERDFNAYVRRFFKGEPQFNDGSPKQMQRLMYGVMGLPIVVRNKPTDTMRKAGIKEGTPKTDALAIAYALQQMDAKIAEANEFLDDPGLEKDFPAWVAYRDDAQRIKSVLEALQLMSMVGTRRSLYYQQYPYFVHWKDGKVRSQHNQSSTNTRRASEAKPNKQQQPKHAKIDGYASRFREVVVPHKPNAVIVSIDFKAQELRLMAEQSQDPVMLSMYIGENKRDQHHLTGLAIMQRLEPQADWDYEAFAAVLENKDHPKFKKVKKIRGLGKKLNFTAEYGAMAPKVAITLMVSEEEAQSYLDAREEMFAVSQQWKEQVKLEAKETGTVRTMMGAVRHLGPAFMSDDKWVASKAERQAVNFKIQGSAAEQTKLAEGRMWERGLFFRYDAVCIGPIHDEIVASVAIEDLFDFIPEMHACMVANYANMTVPIEGDISFGPNFYQQIEIGPVPSREAIQKGLDEMHKLKAANDAAIKEAA